jgi:hypothetical protein
MQKGRQEGRKAERLFRLELELVEGREARLKAVKKAGSKTGRQVER